MFPTKPLQKETIERPAVPALGLPAWVAFVDQVLAEAKSKSLAVEKEKHA